MSHKTQSMRRWGLVPLALVLTLAVFAVPAAAKAPVFPLGCAPNAGKAPAPAHNRARCARRQAAASKGSGLGTSQTTGNGFGWGEAGVLAVLALVMTGGTLVATHRRDADESRPGALS